MEKTVKILYFSIVAILIIVFYGYLIKKNNTFKRVEVGQVWIDVYNEDNPYKQSDTTFHTIISVDGKYCKYVDTYSDNDNSIERSGKIKHLKFGATRFKK